MKSKSTSARRRYTHRRHDYRDANPECEVTPLLWGSITNEFTVPYSRLRDQPCDIHHIAGSGSELHECPENYITVARPIHEWMTDHTLAGFVLSAYIKTLKGEADWDTWTACKSHYRLSAMDNTDFQKACSPYLCIRRMRVDLVGGMR